MDTKVNAESSALIPITKNNPNYSGGQYLFLRFSTGSDSRTQAYRFYIYSANSSEYKPKLNFRYEEYLENPAHFFIESNMDRCIFNAFDVMKPENI